jgi:hypothetical protein
VKSLLALLLPLLLIGPVVAAELDPTAVPARGTIAPAFGLHPVSSKKTEDLPVHELDELCGSRPGPTTAVLVIFVNDNSADDLALANTWQRKFDKLGLEVLAISTVKEPTAFTALVEKSRYRFPVLNDKHGIVSHRYGVPNAPFSFLLNEECRVLGQSNQTLSADEATLGAAVEAQVNGRLGSLGR